MSEALTVTCVITRVWGGCVCVYVACIHFHMCVCLGDLCEFIILCICVYTFNWSSTAVAEHLEWQAYFHPISGIPQGRKGAYIINPLHLGLMQVSEPRYQRQQTIYTEETAAEHPTAAMPPRPHTHKSNFRSNLESRRALRYLEKDQWRTSVKKNFPTCKSVIWKT